MTIQEIEYSEPIPEQIAERNLIRSFKTAIKEDAVNLRIEKYAIKLRQRENGSGSEASAQSRLSTHKLEARSRLLIYGTLRGKTWEQMENKRGENGRLSYYVMRAWIGIAGKAVPMPESLKVFK